MTLPLYKKLRRAGGKVKRYLSRRALILLYHRVAKTDSDPWQIAVTPENFAQHAEILSKHGRLMTLEKFSAAMRAGTLPRRAIIVTFDDGYADNLLNAKPALERYDVPATVFITTGYTGAGREFWWDELDRLFLRPCKLPGELRLNLRGENYNWELSDFADYSERMAHGNRRWRAWHEDDPSPRHLIYRSLWQVMLGMTDRERWSVIGELREWAGGAATARETHRAMSREEIGELAGGGLIDVGCHTVTHPQLSALGIDSQRDEIMRSKACLEEILGRPVASFAYPYGRECDYTADTIRLVRDAGFDCACSTEVNTAGRHSDLFQLPRLQVQDMDGDSFDRLLTEWLRD